MVYKSEVENTVTDALSRIQGYELLCLAISVLSSDLSKQIQDSYTLDPNILDLISLVQQKSVVPGYQLQDGLLRKHKKILV